MEKDIEIRPEIIGDNIENRSVPPIAGDFKDKPATANAPINPPVHDPKQPPKK